MGMELARAIGNVVAAYARALTGVTLIIVGATLGLTRDATILDGQLLLTIVMVLGGGWLLLPRDEGTDG